MVFNLCMCPNVFRDTVELHCHCMVRAAWRQARRQTVQLTALSHVVQSINPKRNILQKVGIAAIFTGLEPQYKGRLDCQLYAKHAGTGKSL